ncbi:TetR family transcriptional regulator [Kibdelosporangium philippinense]|uniref:TetR family transcriptional regulator n=1 Tax=Kibdelosporangium philippinense TaxID=211113 RepID=A0ABS8ZND9_9PSEU|nr:TetR family transcriptional regulator [Kibdelosporangium philippinense]MCE7009067.1 TetR family transcriptional regulator [Kibdelosporangium philippinense]
MTEVTPFSERVRMSLRETLLDAAAELLAEHGFAGLRMVDVAASAGVSRQTVYNEFGSKATLVDAVALRTVSEFLNGSEERWRATNDLATGLHAMVEYTVRHGRENRLVASVLGGAQAEDLLPLLTTRAEPIFRPAIEQASRNLAERVPSLAPEPTAVIAETIVRLAVSHMMLPGGTPSEAADAVCAVILPAVEAQRRVP